MVSKHDHYMVHFWLGLASGLCGFTILFHSLHHFNLFPLVSFRIISMIWWLPNHHHHQHASSSHTSYQWLIYNVVSFSLPPMPTASRVRDHNTCHVGCRWAMMVAVFGVFGDERSPITMRPSFVRSIEWWWLLMDNMRTKVMGLDWICVVDTALSLWRT